MAVEATLLQTPSRPSDALEADSSTVSSPAQLSDDDTISDTSFQKASDHFTFTPKRPTKLPRAWERKPATPFAPRTETQKIWKRVPLQDKTNNGAVEIRAFGKEEADARGVKRVRLTVPDDVDGRENYADTQWDKQSNDAKRKVPKDGKNVLQSTRNSLSPLRRDCTYEILNDTPLPTPLELEAGRVIRRLEQMQQEEAWRQDEQNDADRLPDTAAAKREILDIDHGLQELQHREDHTLQIPSSRKNYDDLAASDGYAASEDCEANTPSTNEFFTDSIIFDDHNSESEIDEMPIAEERADDTDGSDNELNKASPGGPPGSEAVPGPSNVHSIIQETASESSHECVDALLEKTAQPDFQSPSDIVETTTLASTSEPTEGAAPVINGHEAVPDLMDTTEDLPQRLETEFQGLEQKSDETVSESYAIDAEQNNKESEVYSTSERNLSCNEVFPEAVKSLQIPAEATVEEAALKTDTASDIVIFGTSNDHLASQLFTPQAPTILAPEAPPSDDTAYLHDFLTRARAQKAARAANSPEKMDTAFSSPAKNTRQALVNLSTNLISPSKSEQMELKPDEWVENEMQDGQATSPCRRSSRPRLPKPQKSVVPNIPNTIPVRRSNGTEFVFLQRTEAMQIALATRTNTKRNKGEALPPSARLESLDSGELSPIKEKKKGPKTKKVVKWDEKLTQEQLDMVLDDQAVIVEAGAETKQEVQTIVEEKLVTEAEKSDEREKKKVKRLGTVNGTPAPKKVRAATALPVPTRTLRARTKA